MNQILIDRPVKKYPPARYLIPLLLFFLCVVGLCGLFFRFGYHDNQAISAFSAAYEDYDQAIINLSKFIFSENQPDTVSMNDLNSKVDAAINVLQEKSAVRISSLTVNDAEIMATWQEIAQLARKEASIYQIYQIDGIGFDTSPDQLEIDLKQLADQRRSAYIHFRQFAGIKN